MKRLPRVARSLLRLSLGNTAELTVGDCCDYIGWLAKFHKVLPEEYRFLATWACLCMGTLNAEEEQEFWDEYATRKEQWPWLN